jgi:hypothetical protein
MNTFTAQEIKEHYDSYMGYMSECQGKNPQTFPEWLDELYKPTKKVIDLSVLIDGIDCEFSLDSELWYIGTLTSIVNDSMFSKADLVAWKYCQPRMNHKHAWDDGDCPIKGFVVRAWIDKEDFITVHTSANSIDWNDVVYVEFLEVEHGYVMPWESDV